MSYANTNRLVSTTLKNYRKKLIDNLTYSQVVVDMIRRMGGVRTLDGGTSIVEHLLYETNPSVKTYNGLDVLDKSPSEGISTAEFDWKQMSGLAQWSGREEFMNGGSAERLINLADAIIEQLETSFAIKLNLMTFGDGTANGGKDWGGLALLVEDGTAWSTVGTINSDTWTFWRNVWSGSAGSFASNGITKVRTAFNDVTRHGERPNLMVTDQNMYEAYEKILTLTLRITDVETPGDNGMRSLRYKGVPLGFDDDCTAGYWYILNTKYLHLNFGKGREMKSTEVMMPPDQDAKMTRSFMYGNYSTNCRKMNAVITGFTVP